MARVCIVTGKKPMSGNNVSHANNKTQAPFPAEPAEPSFLGGERKPLGEHAPGPTRLRTIDKNGIDAVLAELRASGEKI